MAPVESGSIILPSGSRTTRSKPNVLWNRKIQCTSNVKSEQPCYGLCSLTHSAPKTFRDLLLDGGIPGAGDVLGVPTNVSGDATWLFANYFMIISTFQVRSHAIVD